MNEIKVIFFDMGNTLLHFHCGESDFEKDERGVEYLTQYLNKFSAEIKAEDVKSGFLEKWDEGIKYRKERNTEYPIEEFLNEFLKHYNIALSVEQCVEAIDLFYTEYRNSLYYEEDIYEALSYLKNKGYKIGVISNTCYYEEVMKNCFKKAGIFELIDAFTFSYSIKIAKPKKEIFEIAVQKFNVNAGECVMVGDSLKNDIVPASALGMKTLWLDSTCDNIASTAADIKVSRISEIKNYL